MSNTTCRPTFTIWFPLFKINNYFYHNIFLTNKIVGKFNKNVKFKLNFLLKFKYISKRGGQLLSDKYPQSTGEIWVNKVQG